MMKGTGIHAIGRRKTSVARVYVRPGSGVITVNDLPYEQYFGRETSSMILRQPLELVGVLEQFDVKVNVAGGGKSGQAGAARLGIARALLTATEGSRPALKKAKLLTRDAREVERKKYGRHKARKKPQFSKR